MPPRDRDRAGSGAEAPFLAWQGVEAQGPGDRRGRAGEAAWGAQGQLAPCGHGRQAGQSGLLQAEAPKPGDPAGESPVLRPDLRLQLRVGRADMRVSVFLRAPVGVLPPPPAQVLGCRGAPRSHQSWRSWEANGGAEASPDTFQGFCAERRENVCVT